MPNDVITLNAIACELNEILSGGRIEKVYQPETDEITLAIKSARTSQTLVISANPAHPRIHITSQKKENSYVAPAFCMLLRKYLTGAHIEKIEIFNTDRIVKVSILSKNDLKDINRYFLIVELMGRYSNIILTTENMKIIDAIRRIHFEQTTTRYILPNLEYIVQPKSRISLDETQKIQDLFTNQQITGDLLIKNISGISKETANEIAISLNPYKTFNNFLNIRLSDTYLPSLRYENGILKDYYVYPYSSLSGAYVNYNSLNEALDAFYSLYDSSERKKASTKTVTIVLKRLQAKVERRIVDNLAKLQDEEKSNTYKKQGELILANIYKIKHGDVSLECYDYYCDKDISIPLDPKFSPADNAQIYYKKYSKCKKATEIAQEQLVSLYEQREYLKSIEISIDNCSLKSEYDEILDELNSLSGLRNIRKSRNLKERPSSPTKLSIEGYDVYVGKNNLQNNQVTFKIADGGDTWLHVKAHHGAHVVIKGNPTESVIEKCAAIAAYYSSASLSDKVEVDYTKRKFVKKIPSAMPGMVTYTNYKSLLVSPVPIDKIDLL